MSAQQLITDHLDLWTGAVTHKSGTGRGASGKNGKIELTGIKKLRELILELAVRGKLVEQDPNDEPACVLLDRIAEEKARLVKEGEIKKPKKLAAISSDDHPYPIPNGWVAVRYGDAVTITTGRLDANAASDDGEYPFFTCSRTPSKIDYYDFDCEAVLLAGNGDFNVKMYRGKFNAYQRTYVITPLGFSLKYLYHQTVSQIERITENNRGSAIPYLKIADITTPVVYLPPIAEQYRIVEKVDELMALCDCLEQQVGDQLEAHEVLVDTLLDALTRSADAAEVAENWARVAEYFDTLFTTEASIDKLKQTILQLAVMGRLVEQNSNDEPAIHFLNRYGIEGKPYFLSGWTEVALGNLGEIIGGSTPTKSNAAFWEGDIPWVSPKDMKLPVIQDSQNKVTEKALQQKTLKKVPKNSLLMVVRGMILAHSFPVAINGLEVTINQDMKALVPPKEISPYLLLYLQAEKQKLVGLVDRSSHGTCKLVSEKLWSHVVYLPPIEEQARIIETVDELMALCDRLKARLSEAGETRAQMAETVVERAVN